MFLCPFLVGFNWIVFVIVLLLSCMSSLYTGGIKSLCHIWFANIFTHSVGCLFILLIVSFAVQKLYSLMWSDLFSFAFVTCTFGVISKKSLLSPQCEGAFFPMFSSRSFIVSCLLFKSLVHSRVTSVGGMIGVQFHFSACGY